MKRYLALILALALCLSLAACSADPEPELDAALSRGAVNGSVYTNESLKLQFRLPSDWSFYSEEEIAEVNNMTKEMFESADLKDVVSEGGQFIDFFAASSTNLDNVNLIIQPADPKLSGLTDRQIFEVSEESLRGQFTSAGMEIKSYEVITVKFCAEKSALHVEATMRGFTLQEYQVLVRSDSEYNASLTISSTTITDPQTILDCFSAVK